VSTQPIESPASPALDQLCVRLAELAPRLGDENEWPDEQLRLCGSHGVFRWFVPRHLGGWEWNDADILRGYLKLSSACLTTTFVLTQLTGALKRVVASENARLREEVLPELLDGTRLATIGISHLTTSRRHLGRPALAAEETPGGFRLSGFSPWVTGSTKTQLVVTGAELVDGRQIIMLLPLDTPGVETPPAARLVALSASQTGQVKLQDVELDRRWLLAGPVENVMRQGSGGSTGGLQTSTLAVGLASSAIDFLDQERPKRPDLEVPSAALRESYEAVRDDLLAAAEGHARCSKEEIRTQANSLVLRATQAALTAAKGTGYVVGHPAGRWCQEALFFLVWSCPQPVVEANLCELAGLGEET